MLPNCAVVSPEFCIFKLKVNVEPCVTLVDVGETVAERDGAVFTSKDVLPESGEQVPDTLTVIDCELADVAIRVVQDTLEPLIDLVWLSDTLQTPHPLKSRFAELQVPDHPDAVTVNVLPDITLPESAPDCVIVTVTVALTKLGNKNNANKAINIKPFTIHNSLHRTISQVFQFLQMPVH
jgi:hypothetical protein